MIDTMLQTPSVDRAGRSFTTCQLGEGSSGVAWHKTQPFLHSRSGLMQGVRSGAGLGCARGDLTLSGLCLDLHVHAQHCQSRPGSLCLL